MGLGGCYSVIKFVLVIFNLLFWILGIAGVVFSIWMMVDPTFSVSLTQEPTDYLVSLIIILVLSILLVIVSGLGVFGALRESQCALVTFFSFLLIIFVAEISAGLWAYINRADLEVQIRNAVKKTVEEEYALNDNRRLLFDTFQRNLHCCGTDKATNWSGTKLQLNILSAARIYDIPSSCCRPDKTEDECKKATQKLKFSDEVNYDVVFDKGCYKLIIDKLKEHACLLMGIGIAIIVIQFLGLIFSLVLAFAVNRSNRYKA